MSDNTKKKMTFQEFYKKHQELWTAVNWMPTGNAFVDVMRLWNGLAILFPERCEDKIVWERGQPAAYLLGIDEKLPEKKQATPPPPPPPAPDTGETDLDLQSPLLSEIQQDQYPAENTRQPQRKHAKPKSQVKPRGR